MYECVSECVYVYVYMRMCAYVCINVYVRVLFKCALFHTIISPLCAPNSANAYMTTIRAQMDAHEKRVSDMFGADVRAYASPFQPKSKDLESNVWA